MTLPVGVTTCTVTLSRPKNSIGTEGDLVEVRLSADRRLVWPATGESLYETFQDVTPEAGSGISVPVAHVDQAGWVDRTGAAVTFWGYKLTYRTVVAGQKSSLITKRFQVLVGQTTVDLDKVADGAAIPAVVSPTVYVTSVAGLQGAVDAEDLAAELEDYFPEPDLTGYATSADLSSGLSGKVNTGTYSAGQTAQDNALAAEVARATAAEGTKADLVGGVVPTAQIPALALTATFPVADQASMLALTAAQVQPGDVAVRADGAGTFILTATDPSVLGNWTRLNAPTDLVGSVNGQTGTVVLAKGDLGLGSVDNVSAANLRDRSTHTGTQVAATISDLTPAALIALLTNLAVNNRGNLVAFFGDSITEGPQASTPYAFVSMSHARQWCDWWTFSNFQRIRSIGNWAVGGTTIEHARDNQLPMMLRSGRVPDSVVLAVGTNNLTDTTAVAWAKFTELLYRVALLGIRPVLTTVPPNGFNGAKVAPWNALIRALAAQTGLPMIERNTPLRNGTDEATYNATYTADNIHPNDAGHRTLGLAVTADATLAGKFNMAMPGLDRNTSTGVSADTYNLARNLWNTDTGWDYTAWNDAHAWGNATFAGDPVGGNVRQLNLSGYGTVKADIPVPAKTDTELMMLFSFTGNGPRVTAQPRDASTDLGPDFALFGYPTSSGTGVLHTIVKAPAGMTTIRLIIFGVAVKVGALTARTYLPLG